MFSHQTVQLLVSQVTFRRVCDCICTCANVYFVCHRVCTQIEMLYTNELTKYCQTENTLSVTLLYHCTYVAGEDFQATEMQLTFQPNVQSLPQQQCVDVSILEDAFIEDLEEFTVSLNSDDLSVRFSLSTASVTIIDTDGKLVVEQIFFSCELVQYD